MNFQVLY